MYVLQVRALSWNLVQISKDRQRGWASNIQSASLSSETMGRLLRNCLPYPVADF